MKSLVTSTITDTIIDDLGKDAKLCMEKCLNSFEAQTRSKLEPLWSSSALLDSIKAIQVEKYGSSKPLREVACDIKIDWDGDLLLTVWSDGFAELKEAIHNSGLGFSFFRADPYIDGYRIDVPLPPNKGRSDKAVKSLLDKIKAIQVESVGSRSALQDVASVEYEDGALTVTLWDDNIGLAIAVEQAIRNSSLGLDPTPADANPYLEGYSIWFKRSPLTENRRREFVKVVRGLAEKAIVDVRNVSRDAAVKVKALVKDRSISESDEQRFQKDNQKLTDTYVKKIDEAVAAKVAKIMKS